MSTTVTSISKNSYLSRLQEMREHGGAVSTTGIASDVIGEFLRIDDSLGNAIERAWSHYVELRDSNPAFLELDETAQVETAQAGFTNFYDVAAVNPYVAAAAEGPWIVTLKGAVVYDCGGYGMLGLGHAPGAVLDAGSLGQR